MSDSAGQDPWDHEQIARPFVYEDKGVISLHFGIATVQSSMIANEPDQLTLAYTRTMMACLLFMDRPRHITMIGLGGGSLPKYCRRYLPDCKMAAIEINPHIIALRNDFSIPEDSEYFRIICADGAYHIANTTMKTDIIMVDGFDPDGQAPTLCTQCFYDHCHDALDETGILVVNLSGADKLHEVYISRLRQSFDGAVSVVTVPDCSNKIAFALKGAILRLSEKQLLARAVQLERHHPIGFRNVVHRLMQGRRSETMLA